jgi:hypothetical protein
MEAKRRVTTSPKARRWTRHELAELRRLAASTPVRDIARSLDRTVVAVRTKAAHERLPLLPDETTRGPVRARAPWERPPGV